MARRMSGVAAVRERGATWVVEGDGAAGGAGGQVAEPEGVADERGFVGEVGQFAGEAQHAGGVAGAGVVGDEGAEAAVETDRAEVAGAVEGVEAGGVEGGGVADVVQPDRGDEGFGVLLGEGGAEAVGGRGGRLDVRPALR
jgi:hypothetical protein